MKEKRRFKGKPINDRPADFDHLLKFARKGPYKINEKYPDVKLDLPGYFLARNLGNYFKDKDLAIEELKAILYDPHDGGFDYKKTQKDIYEWLRWYFPKMMKSITKGYTKFIRGFETGLPGDINRTMNHSLDALTYLFDFIKNGNSHCDYGTRFLLNEVDCLKSFIEQRGYIEALQDQYPVLCKTPLDWDPVIEEHTREAQREYKKGGLPGYVHYMREFVLANNRVHADHRVDETRFLPKNLWGRVDFGEVQIKMYTLPDLPKLTWSRRKAA